MPQLWARRCMLRPHPTGPHPPSRTSPTAPHHTQVMRHRSVPPRTKSLDGELVVKAKNGAALDGACAMAKPSRRIDALRWDGRLHGQLVLVATRRLKRSCDARSIRMVASRACTGTTTTAGHAPNPTASLPTPHSLTRIAAPDRTARHLACVLRIARGGGGCAIRHTRGCRRRLLCVQWPPVRSRRIPPHPRQLPVLVCRESPWGVHV
jgi:hypothetical protein